MFFKFVLLGIVIVVIIFFLDIILPKLSFKYKLYKEYLKTKKRKKEFRNKMKELEIK